MTVSEYLRYTYRPIPAGNYAEAVIAFFRKYGYTPAPVFGAPGCGDALESQYVPAGFYSCAIREAEGAWVNRFCAMTTCHLAGKVGCDETCQHWPYLVGV